MRLVRWLNRSALISCRWTLNCRQESGPCFFSRKVLHSTMRQGMTVSSKVQQNAAFCNLQGKNNKTKKTIKWNWTLPRAVLMAADYQQSQECGAYAQSRSRVQCLYLLHPQWVHGVPRLHTGHTDWVCRRDRVSLWVWGSRDHPTTARSGRQLQLETRQFLWLDTVQGYVPQLTLWFDNTRWYQGT